MMVGNLLVRGPIRSNEVRGQARTSDRGGADRLAIGCHAERH
jgi:hypothetical protein